MFRPLAGLVPAVRRADRQMPFGHRVLYTGMSVSVFLVCSHLPLYGVRHAAVGGADPLYWVRSLLASTRGTLMELGVAPVVTAGTVMQLLTGSKFLRVDQNVREDRELVDAARKALAMTIALGEATAHVLLGRYGSVGVFNGALIVMQLFTASAMVIFLDELLDKGYGLAGASAISLLSATNTCGKVVWQAFSPVTVVTARGAHEFEGLALAMVRGDGLRALVATMFRRHLPNVLNLMGTALVLLAAVFLEGFRCA
ncbi:hypothetical protein PR202_ga01706 [Eleusine coracana subsp. coracana]|uniref:Translocon Sec61/SecY plug domain-containing protein n=1 Tax=Eleusine coracana subsp. coracana TaxID=191504 RepID=A0AAV5BKW2_ELECO|nr:hypothetical protein PR202_ga01019 [Eleusine coracana subsp. coracana]GJM85899.1 hypothetical protein PR202_ga01706 [Eleusine coracana subsp. coracana]